MAALSGGVYLFLKVRSLQARVRGAMAVSSSAGGHLSGCTAGYPSIVLEAGILHLFMRETADVEEHAP